MKYARLKAHEAYCGWRTRFDALYSVVYSVVLGFCLAPVFLNLSLGPQAHQGFQRHRVDMPVTVVPGFDNEHAVAYLGPR
jgi:hypothetical protein